MNYALRFRRRTIAALWLVLWATAAPGAEKLHNALDFVPADASFFSSSLRLREQWDIAANSRAWQKLKNLPAVQMFWPLLQFQINQPDGPLQQYRDWVAQPENRQLVELGIDLVSHEIFVYGDERFPGWLKSALEATSLAGDAARLQAADEEGEADGPAARRRAAIVEHLIALTRLPGGVIGFRVSDRARTTAQLARLETLAKELLKSTEPPLDDRLRRTKVGEHELLTLELDGSLIDWDQLDLGDFDPDSPEGQKIVEAVTKMKLTVALGVWNDYLLLGVGNSSEPIAKLGQGALLVDSPKLKPLLAAREARLADVSYLSQAFQEVVATKPEDLEELASTVDVALRNAGDEVPEGLAERVHADVKTLVQDITPYLPKPGAAVGFTLLTDEGYEMTSYDWTQNPGVDGSKPLPLARHLGGAPLAALVARSKYSPRDYELLTKWLKIGWGYFRDFGLPRFEARERREVDEAIKLAEPLVARLDEITGKMLLPSLSDGQSALVLDAAVSSKQPHRELPESAAPLPLPELALALGVSDAALFEKAMAEYRAVAEDAIRIVREKAPEAIPAELPIPPATVRQTDAGRVFSIPLPDEVGLDRQFAPSAGLGPTLVVLSTSPAQVERMLAEKPLSAGRLTAAGERPLAAAGHLDFARIVDAARPWIEYGLQEARKQGELQVPGLEENVRGILDVLKVLQSVSGVRYLEGDATVTRVVWRIQDVPAP